MKISMLLEALIQGARESAESFLGSLAPPQSISALWAILIFLVSFILFAFLAPNVLGNGDAVVYEDQIKQLDFSQRTIHLGFYLIATPFIHLLPGPTDYIFNLVNCFFGGLSAAVLYLIALLIFRKQTVALVSSSFLMANFLFVTNSVFAEVYGVQTFFLLLAVYLWLLDKPIATGLAFAMSVLVTPSSLFAFPLYVLIRPYRRALIWLFVTVLFVLGIALTPHLDDFLVGGRGLLLAERSPVDIGKASLKEIIEVFFGMFLVVPYVIAGIAAAIRQRRLRTLGSAIFTLWLFSFVLGERFGDVPVQLPTYALLCLIGAGGFDTLASISYKKEEALFIWVPSALSLLILLATTWAIRSGSIAAEISISERIFLAYCSILVVFVLIGSLWQRGANPRLYNFMMGTFLVLILGCNSLWLYRLVAMDTQQLLEYKSTVLQLSKMARPDYVAVGSWDRGILFEHFVFQKSYTGRWISTEFLFGESGVLSPREETMVQWQQAITKRREIWILDFNSLVVGGLQNAGYVIEPFKDVWRAQAAGD